MSDTVNAGSDDATVLYCQPCGNVLADAFCRDCSEYLCSNCTNVHEKLGITKNHTLLKGSKMPSFYNSKGKTSTPSGLFQKCTLHPDEDRKLFCETHGSACCSACSVAVHKQCSVVYIPDAAKTYKSGPEYRKLIDDVKETEQLAATRLIDIDKKMKAVDKQETDELEMLNKYRAEVITFVDKRVKELSSQIKQIRNKDIASLKEEQSQTQKVQADLSSAKSKLKTCEQRPFELFTESKHYLPIIAKLQSQLADIEDKSVYQQYKVRKDANMEAMLDSKTGLATVELMTGWLCLPLCFIPRVHVEYL